MAIPSEIATGKENEQYKRTVVGRSDHFIDEFRNYMNQLGRLPFIDGARFEVHVHSLSPLFKFIIINQSRAFFGLYPIAETPVRLGDSVVPFWDYRGERTLMVGARANGLKLERELYNNLTAWYDSVWNNVSREV